MYSPVRSATVSTSLSRSPVCQSILRFDRSMRPRNFARFHSTVTSSPASINSSCRSATRDEIPSSSAAHFSIRPPMAANSVLRCWTRTSQS